MGELENRMIAAAHPRYVKGVNSLVTKELVPYWWLKKHDRINYGLGGRGTEWRVRMRQGTPIGYSGGLESINFSVRNDFEVPTLAYRGIADGYIVTWGETQECKGKEAIFKLMDELTANLDEDLLQALVTDFYGDGTGRSSLTIHGLAAFISTSATYAGISQSTSTAWASNVVSGTNFSSDPVGKILRLKNAAAKGTKGGKARSTLSIALCPDAVFEMVAAKIEGSRRYVEDKDAAKAGFDSYVIHQVPVVKDENCTASTLYGLDHTTIELNCTTDEVFEPSSGWETALPKVFTGVAISHMNLVCKSPRNNGSITSIT